MSDYGFGGLHIKIKNWTNISYINAIFKFSGDGERENVFLRQNCLAARNVHRYCLNKQDMLFQLSVPVLCVCFHFFNFNLLVTFENLLHSNSANM